MKLLKPTTVSIALLSLLFAQPMAAQTRSSQALPNGVASVLEECIPTPNEIKRRHSHCERTAIHGEEAGFKIDQLLLVFGGLIGLVVALGASGGNDSPG
jgi:hypothetical protein